ncbi:hypothetical protein ACEPAG_4943 [Sanghuangporus baumii]
MNSDSLGNVRITSCLATASRGRGNSKPSMLKRLKKLIRKSQVEILRQQPEASTSSMEHRRRVEALKSCGLLKQSVKYGTPYRDEEDDAKTIMSPATEKRWGEDTEDKKDLITFHDKVDELPSGEDVILNTVDKKLMPVYCASTLESDSSTLTPGHPPIRMRRLGSLAEEIDQIEDEESRHLTEVAFLS